MGAQYKDFAAVTQTELTKLKFRLWRLLDQVRTEELLENTNREFDIHPPVLLPIVNVSSLFPPEML